ncbi:ATP-grasp domain-containing protein, partial [Streptomyces anulatus]
MDLFEHQAKELFAEYGIPVPRGIVAHTVEEARAAAEELTGRVVVKAQVKTGGRGKAGGVKVADDAADAEQKATQIL